VKVFCCNFEERNWFRGDNCLKCHHSSKVRSLYLKATLEDQDSSCNDISRLVAQMKCKLKLEKDRKEKERKPLRVLKETRERIRLYCYSCEKGTGVNRDGCKECEH